MTGTYYTPKHILEPQAESGKFLQDTAETVTGNPPYEAQPVPTYPCEDCPVVRGEFCWTCPLPMEHLKIKPVCEFCGEPAVTGIIIPYRIEGDFGVTFASFDTIPVCGSQDCREEAEHVRAMAQ